MCVFKNVSWLLVSLPISCISVVHPTEAQKHRIVSSSLFTALLRTIVFTIQDIKTVSKPGSKTSPENHTGCKPKAEPLRESALLRTNGRQQTARGFTFRGQDARKTTQNRIRNLSRNTAIWKREVTAREGRSYAAKKHPPTFTPGGVGGDQNPREMMMMMIPACCSAANKFPASRRRGDGASSVSAPTN